MKPHLVIVFFSVLAINTMVRAQQSFDSTKSKLPKHYFQSQIQLDGYRKPSQKLNTNSRVGSMLVDYGIRQGNLSVLVPVYTRDWQGVGNESNVQANEHLLITGLVHTFRPQFSGISDHRLRKSGVGIRYIRNSGKKAVWFVEVAPFVTRDMTYKSDAYLRMSSTLIYSHNARDWFNFRMGITKSFAWGNRLYLPFIGIRIGRLDKLNMSIQFPRQLTVNLPIGKHWLLALYSKPQGGMYNFSNYDTLYFKAETTTFHFTRYELNTGIRADFRGKSLHVFLASGFCTRNNITFYSDQKNKGTAPYRVYFYTANPAITLFTELGMIFKFGKSRSIYNNKNLYDALDLNGSNGAGDQNAQIPMQTKRQVNEKNLESIRDLVEYDDL